MFLEAKMTIGETLSKKTRFNIVAGLISWLAYAGSIYVSNRTGNSLLPIFFLLPFMYIVLRQILFIRCPRCKGKLGQLLALASAPWSRKRQITHCPNCKVDFNDPI